MSKNVKSDIIRAWKDEEFRSQLSDAERDMIPANPAGILELTDEALEAGAAAEVQLPSCDWCSC